MARISFAQMVCFVGMCLVASISAFVVPTPVARASALAPRTASALRTPSRCNRLRMSEEDVVEEAEEAVAQQEPDAADDATQSVKSFFAPNSNVRLGSSRDQDGKSNVWAVEPKMRVEGTDVEAPEGNQLAVMGGIVGAMVVVMAATIALLPNADSL